MNRIISIIIILCIISFSCATSFCETNRTSAVRFPDAFQFCELYVRRMIELENSLEMNIQIVGMGYDNSLKSLYESEGIMCANCCGGKIFFSPDDYVIKKWETFYFFLGDDQKTFTKGVLKSAIAISVLEYDDADEAIMRLQGNPNPVFKVYDEILTPINSRIDTVIQSIHENETRIKIYEGKYRYYIDYFESNDGTKALLLSAE